MTSDVTRLAPPGSEPGRPYSSPEFHYSAVLPGLWIGEAPRPEDIAILLDLGVTDVINLTSLDEFLVRERDAGFTVHHFPFPDGGFVGDPTSARRVETGTVMERAASCLATLVEQGARTYLHCVAGISRSPCVLALWMIDSGRAIRFDQAVEWIRAIRRVASPNPELVRIVRQLRPDAFDRW